MSLAAIDQEIARVSRSITGVPANANTYATIQTLLDKIAVAAIDPATRAERRLAAARLAIGAPPTQGGDIGESNRHMRNVAMVLLGTDLRELDDRSRFVDVRGRYANTLVDFVVSLKRQRVPDYMPRPVFVNMPKSRATDTEAERQRQYDAFQAENDRNSAANRQQASVVRELDFIQPQVVQFLQTQYANDRAGRQEFDRLLAAVR